MSVLRIVYREEMQQFEDNIGNFYMDIEDIINKNEEYFSKREQEFFKCYWTTVEFPKRINLNEDLTWEVNF